MNTRARTRILATVAVASVSALALAGCSGNTGDASQGNADEDVTLTVTTFGTFGYEDLYKEYEEAHPNVTIEATNIDTGGNARTDAFTKIAAGSGLSDIVAIEEGWLGAVMDVSDTFVDLRDFGIEDRKGDWVDWKYGQATDSEGRVIGYGTDIGPSGICYNGAAFEAAGLPSDRESVAELLDGEVVLPVAVEQLGDGLAVAGQASGLERGAVVADAARTDVGAVADDTALGIRRLSVLPVDPVGLAVLDAEVAQVDEGVGDVHDGAEPALFDRDDVAEAGAGRDLGERVGAGVAAGVDVGGLDGDVRVLVLVLRVEVVVAEGAERGDGQRDRLVAAVAAATGGAAAEDESE